MSRRWLAVYPQRPRFRFVEITFRIIGAQHVFKFACRARESFCWWIPFRKARVVDWDNLERCVLQGLQLLEYSDFSTLDEARIAAIHPELHDRCGRMAARVLQGRSDWIRRHAEPPAGF